MQETKQLIEDLNRYYQLELAEHLDTGQLETWLAEKINRMIREDFEGLVRLLYRVDVSEGKLRALLAEADQAADRGATSGTEPAGGALSGDGQVADAGRIIARLIMERQWQKIESRKKYSRGPQEPGEEEW